MEVTVQIRDIENLKTSTGVKVEKDKDGEVTDRRLVTKIQFEAESPVHVIIGSPQAIMEVLEREPVFAEA